MRPRWKYELARAQEIVSTRVTRITAGEGVAFVPPERPRRGHAGGRADRDPAPARPGLAPPPPADHRAAARPMTATADGPVARRALLRRDGHPGPGPLVVPGPAGAGGRPAGRARWPPGATVIDVGCGTGDNLGALDVGGRADGGRGRAVGVRRAPRPPRRAAAGCGPAWPGPSTCRSRPACADLVTSMDVIEHLDDDAALAEYRRVVRPGGRVLLTVPAYQWLWSDHDTWAAHRRRYSRRTLVAAVAPLGPRPRRVTYFNSFLVPPAAVLRRTPARRLVKGEQDEVGASSPAVDRVMTGLAGLERRWAAPARALRAVDRLPGRSALSRPERRTLDLTLPFRSSLPSRPTASAGRRWRWRPSGAWRRPPWCRG